ncbi:Abi-like protein [Corynebacterium oculi]|uniref:Abi-like protein n=2 Tax=Corynebacterium oculi TaxID=1544416 RepID=A0A0Q0UDK8_9CORY|nr:Abi-like protein [Corynebacterium oculi]
MYSMYQSFSPPRALLGSGLDLYNWSMQHVSSKPPTSVPEQISLLRERGMQMSDTIATQWLSTVGYYRLSGYWYPARIIKNGRRENNFIPGTHFNDAISLYEADRKLRTLVHDGMERIEVALRTKLCNQICANDSLAYTDPSIFRPTFNHQSWTQAANKRIKRSLRHNEAIKHYKNDYAGDYPFWVMAEVLDFSDISRLYEGLKTGDQREIAENLGITIDLHLLSKEQRNNVTAGSPMARWFEHFTIIRNTCAHHGRLWNKSFVPTPTNALRTISSINTLPQGQSEKIYGALILMSYLLQGISPGTTWPNKVSSLIKESFFTNPIVTPQALGAPSDWDGSISSATLT